MDKEFKYVIFESLAAIIVLLAIFAFFNPSYANTSAQYTELRVFNPYSSISIKLMIKCDHNYRTGQYAFYKTIVIRRSSNTVIRAPMGLKKCEIWPIGMKMFGDLK